jgi:hypothetical protein
LLNTAGEASACAVNHDHLVSYDLTLLFLFFEQIFHAKVSFSTSSLRGPQARGNPDGLSDGFGVPGNGSAGWIAASLRSSQ